MAMTADEKRAALDALNDLLDARKQARGEQGDGQMPPGAKLTQKIDPRLNKPNSPSKDDTDMDMKINDPNNILDKINKTEVDIDPNDKNSKQSNKQPGQNKQDQKNKGQQAENGSGDDKQNGTSGAGDNVGDAADTDDNGAGANGKQGQKPKQKPKADDIGNNGQNSANADSNNDDMGNSQPNGQNNNGQQTGKGATDQNNEKTVVPNEYAKIWNAVISKYDNEIYDEATLRKILKDLKNGAIEI